VAAWSQAVLVLMLRKTRLQLLVALLATQAMRLMSTTTSALLGQLERQALEVYRGRMSAWAAVSQAQAS
jgi:hypothetical protein